MKKIVLFSLLMILGMFYSCTTEPTPQIIEAGQVWTRIDSTSQEDYIYETLTVLHVKDGYATVDYNGWWLSVRRVDLIQNIYTYERTLNNE